jgi:hypothetical protein
MRSQVSNTTIIAPAANSPQPPVRRRRAQSVQAVQGISRISQEPRRVSLFETNVSSISARVKPVRHDSFIRLAREQASTMLLLKLYISLALCCSFFSGELYGSVRSAWTEPNLYPQSVRTHRDSCYNLMISIHISLACVCVCVLLDSFCYFRREQLKFQYYRDCRICITW